ncbi:hypothetical protein [Chryseobacterium sp.]|uniref:hypothetical protein n=1 Tax=Chryseobacterium sp. TaxID=1871047 RepID=UPI0025BBB1E4|nr:hypothetical protein [Chryseobacterium sp.]
MLLPIVPMMIAPGTSFTSAIIGDATSVTLRTSSPKSLAARITPFQSSGSTTIFAVIPFAAIRKEPFSAVCCI